MYAVEVNAISDSIPIPIIMMLLSIDMYVVSMLKIYLR